MGAATEAEEQNVEKMTVKQLKSLCKERGLDASGLTKKDEFIALLNGADDDDEGEIDLDELDRDALIALAKEEDIELPDGADDDTIRDLIAEAYGA